jgi:1-acyl-sn-glycerol-3-phosphate acyltransferase
MKFKNGAFKMAHKAQAPVIAFSINGGSQCMPPHWMFPYQPASNCCELVIHEPVESKGKTEDELAAEVRRVMITGLADDHKPDE